ncbi:MAG: WYL domain-containing protein [Treponema sp.]|nr:WYL domain-containing protein [Treponema sp.]
MEQKKKTEPKNNSYHTLNYLMKIDQAIRNGEYPNANKLNKMFGTRFSRSTFGRYIRTLRDDYEAPIEFDYQKNGYYYTDNTFYIQQVMLKEGELLTLSTILPLLEQYKNTPMEESFRNLMTKLIEMMPDNITVDSALINNEVHFISDPITKLEDGVFENVLKATKLHRTLEMEYKTAQNKDYEVRRFNPYHIICQKGSWYVLGYSYHAEAIRLYAMPRIRNCKITNDKFSIPKDFKLEQHIDVQMGAWGNSGEKFKVEIEFVKGLKTYVMERTWHKGQTLKENKDGSVYLSFETNQLGQVVAWVMSFTGGAKVLNPPELKKRVADAAREILKNS